MRKLLLAIALVCFGGAAHATCPVIPFIFKNGTPMNANQVNDNFSSLRNCINSATGPITGPASSSVGHIATWNNTTGTLLADGGVPVSALPIFPETYGAKGDCVTDDTVALQSAIAAAQALPKGQVVLGPHCYAFTPPLSITGDGIHLSGSGPFSTFLKGPPNSFSNFINVGGNAPTASQTQGVIIENIGLLADTPSNGYAISSTHVANTTIHDIYVGSTWCGIEDEQSNTSYYTRIWGYTVGTNCEAFKWWVTPSAQAAGGRSDQLFLKDIGINSQYYGNDGFVWKGMANTLNAQNIAFLQTKRGFFVDASQNTTNLFPAFASVYNLQVEGAQVAACEIDGGRYMFFTDSFCYSSYGQTGAGGTQGNNDTAGLLIQPDGTASVTSDIHWENSSIGVSAAYGALMHAQGVYFSNVSMRGSSLKVANSTPSIQIDGGGGFGSADYAFSNVKFCGVFGDTIQNNYGLVIGDPVGTVHVSNGDFQYCQTGEVSSSDSLFQFYLSNSSDRNGQALPTSAGSFIDNSTPTASACGTSPTLEGNSLIGTIITAGDTGTTCSIAFSVPVVRPVGGGPVQLMLTTNNPAITVGPINVLSTGFDISASAALAGTIVYWRVSQGAN